MTDIEEFGNELNNVIHIKMTQRTSRKSITTVEGIPEQFDFPKILRFWKITFNCNGRIEEKEKGKDKDKKTNEKEKEYVIVVSGDHREEISKFLQDQGIALKQNIKVHGV